MNKKAAALFLLFTIGTTSAIGFIGGLVLVGGGVALGSFIAHYILGLQQKVEELQEWVEYLQDLQNQTFNVVKDTISYDIASLQNTSVAENLAQQDFAEYTKNRAWTLAKYEALKTLNQELQNGTDFSTALSRAQLQAIAVVDSYYSTLVNNTVLAFTERNDKAYLSIVNGLEEAKADAASKAPTCSGTECKYSSLITFKGYEYGGYYSCSSGDAGYYVLELNGGAMYLESDVSDVVWRESKTVNALSRVFSYNLTTLKRAGALLNETAFLNTINAYDAAYHQVVDNLNAYLNGLTQEIYSSGNITELLDPITLATQINNDYEQTGYYGFAAAELAMLGLPLTGLNKTITIDVNGTTLSGILFTDWEGVLERNQTYTADSQHLWYFVDENGKLYDLQGYNFTVVDLRDKDGNPLQNTTFERYVDHSGDIQKIYDELAKLNELYQRYLEMQATLGGGASGGLGSWWASLSDTEKIAIIAAGAVIIILLARK